jgi:hypothetical protein
MFERYFVRPGTIDHIRSSWLADAIETYVTWLAAQSYSPRCVLRRVPQEPAMCHQNRIGGQGGACPMRAHQ